MFFDHCVFLRFIVCMILIVFILQLHAELLDDQRDLFPLIDQIVLEDFVPHVMVQSRNYTAYTDVAGKYEILFDHRKPRESSRDEVTVRLHFENGYPLDFYLINDEYIIDSFECNWLSYNLADITIPAGVYDMFTIFEVEGVFRFVMQQLNIITASSHNFIHRYIDALTADIQLTLDGCDNLGNSLYPNDRYTANFLYYLPEKNFSFSFGQSENFMYTSQFSEPFQAIFTEKLHSAESIISTQYGPYEEIVTNLTLTNDPDDFISQHIQLLIPQTNYEPKIGIFDMMWFFIYNDDLVYGGFGVIDDVFEIQGEFWEIDLYMMEQHLNIRGITPELVLYDFESNENFYSLYSVAPFHCREDKIGSFWNVPYNDFDHLSPDGSDLVFGNYPSYYLTYYRIDNDDLDFYPFPMKYNCELAEGDWNSDLFQLFDSNGSLVSEGLMYDLFGTYLPPDIYTLEIYDDDLRIAGLDGFAQQKTIFDVTQQYSNPPSLTSLKILNSEGLPVNRLEFGESGNLVFSASDVEFIDSVYTYSPIVTDQTELSYKLHNETQWQPLSCELMAEYPNFNWNNGKFFSADLTSLTQTDSVAYDLNFYVEDADGNSCEWTLSPAFVVGDFSGVNADDPVIPDSSFQILHLTAYPNPFNPSTTISFSLNTSLRNATTRQAETTENIELAIYNLKGQKVKVLDCCNSFAANTTNSCSTYSVIWNGTDKNNNPVSSGVYFYILKSGDYEKTKKMLLLK